ncbi:MAG: methionine ABC transporter ATP-binding protein [Corynebacterium sp.]|nr:methionine ABC transporter ATP-binding protein [Corynebacterium sp.]
MTGTRVEFKDVTKVFKSGKTTTKALDGVSLSVEPGEVIGIIGYSGAGKSTLVRLINGLDTPTSGSITIDGKEIVGLGEREYRGLRRNIGMIFQQFNLFSSRTAAGNIEYPLKLAGVPRAERKKRVEELLEFVGLSDRGGNYPEQLSGGQKQRVGIARALATNPSLLLCDEATSALDPDTTQEVLKLLRRVNKELGITIVVITHEMDVVRSIADKVVVMETGKVIEQGPVYQIFSKPQNPTTARFVQTTLRNTPDLVEADELRAKDGRVFTIDLSSKSGFFAACAKAQEAGVDIKIVHGGVTTMQHHSFGKMTVCLSGNEQAVEEFYQTLRARTDVEEIV